jgi:hypothetical protein
LLAVDDFNIFTPVWKLQKELYVQNSGSWNEVKELYVQDGGLWKKIYNRNYWPSSGYQHPYWEFSMNPEFNFNDGGICYTSFWSVPSGTHVISDGVASVRITGLNLDSTTQDITLSTNITNGSDVAVVKNTNDLSPLTQTNVDSGTTVKWSVSGAGIQSNTFVNNILNATEIRLSKNATNTATSVNVRYQRTWNSGYSGVARMQGQIPLRVSPGQTYSLSAAPNAGTLSNTSWAMGVITAPTSAGADFFGTGSSVQEGPRYNDLTNRAWAVTIPSGHNFMRPMLIVEHNSTSYPTNMPRYYDFNWFRVTNGVG